MTPNVRALLERLKTGEPVVTGKIELVHCQINGRRIAFCLDREHDPIQRHHRRGRFYEARELERLREHVSPGATIVDIGANIGNHAMFFAIELGATRVIPIEPNPVAYRLLISNTVLNGLCEVIDLSFLGVGISDRRAGGFGVERRARNIGAARMLPGEGQIETWPGDELLDGVAPDLIKIDVEGMEMQALSGLARTCADHRPILFVEVDLENDEAFHAWTGENGYRVDAVWQRYKTNRNYLLLPDD